MQSSVCGSSLTPFTDSPAGNLGHPGITWMKRLFHELYWWLQMSVQVNEHITRCTRCQFSEKSSPPATIPKITIPCPSVQWSKIGVDIVGPFADAPQNHQYIVTAIDYATNIPECLLMSDIRSSKLITWLEEPFSRYGNLDQLVSDNGPQFTSVEFANILKGGSAFARIFVIMLKL